MNDPFQTKNNDQIQPKTPKSLKHETIDSSTYLAPSDLQVESYPDIIE